MGFFVLFGEIFETGDFSVSKELKRLLICGGAALILLLIIILPGKIEYLKSDDHGYDKQCAELEKQLKKEYRGALKELDVYFKNEENTLYVDFYEGGVYFPYVYACKGDVEKYLNANPDFFANKMESTVKVQSLVPEFVDYPTTMYAYTGKCGGNVKLDTLWWTTDLYEIIEGISLDITKIRATNYANADVICGVLKYTPEVTEVEFAEMKHKLTAEQAEQVRAAVPEGCEVICEIKEEK